MYKVSLLKGFKLGFWWPPISEEMTWITLHLIKLFISWCFLCLRYISWIYRPGTLGGQPPTRDSVWTADAANVLSAISWVQHSWNDVNFDLSRRSDVCLSGCSPSIFDANKHQGVGGRIRAFVVHSNRLNHSLGRLFVEPKQEWFCSRFT